MAKYHVVTQEKSPWQQSVIDKDLTTPPSSPSKGDRYLIITGDSYTDWEGHDNEITYYDGSAWQFVTPLEGFHVWVDDENKVYQYNGSSWSEEGSGSGDMLKSTYDTDNDGIVDKAEELDNGASSTLKVVDATNPELKFTDKNGKVFKVIYDSSSGDDQVWKLETDAGTIYLTFDQMNNKIAVKGGSGYTTELDDTVDIGDLEISSNGSGSATFTIDGTDVLEVNSGGEFKILASSFFPNSDNSLDLGDSSHRFKDAYIAGNVSDGTNSASVADIKDAVDKKHTQNTDTKLDEGGANEITAAQAKEAYDREANYISEYGQLEFNI